MTYLFLKEVAESTDSAEIIIVVASLTKDMNSQNDIYRANSIRVLCKIIDAGMLGQIERYIRQANRKENYTAYKPTGNSSNNDFPGAGFAVNGIHSKVNRYLERELWHGIKEGEADFITAQKLYREALVNGEEYLKDTTFLFFRGFIAVFNEKEMIIDGKPHALIIFNEHFQNENLRMAYIIPVEKINQFLRNPYKSVNEKNILYP